MVRVLGMLALARGAASSIPVAGLFCGSLWMQPLTNTYRPVVLTGRLVSQFGQSCGACALRWGTHLLVWQAA